MEFPKFSRFPPHYFLSRCTLYKPVTSIGGFMGKRLVLSSLVLAACACAFAQTRPGAVSKTAGPRATAAGLSQMHRAIRGGGTSIELDNNHGSADARDRDFTSYEA